MPIWGAVIYYSYTSDGCHYKRLFKPCETRQEVEAAVTAKLQKWATKDFPRVDAFGRPDRGLVFRVQYYCDGERVE